jgi:hypothetical protein
MIDSIVASPKLDDHYLGYCRQSIAPAAMVGYLK